MRCTGLSVTISSRSRLSARCEPRFVPATAWISSMITVSTPLSVAAAFEVSMRYRDSGVVMRISGGCRSSFDRSDAGVSPDRTPTRTGATGSPNTDAMRAIPASGAAKLRSTSTPRALSGEMYNTLVGLVVGCGVASDTRSDRKGALVRRDSDHRNAARVLPDPVGATTRA